MMHSTADGGLRRVSATALFSSFLALTVALPAAAAYEAAAPEPLRSAKKLRAQDITARGDDVVLGWREGGKPDRLWMSLSRDGGETYQKGSGKLRRFGLVGLAGHGLSLSVCGPHSERSFWAVTAYRSRTDRAGESDVLLTRRGLDRPASNAVQLFITSPRAKRQVRDADVACVGDHHLAIAWLEKKDGRTRARLAIRRLTDAGRSESVRKINLGPAVMKGGIAVAATPSAIHVVWTKNDKHHLRYERFRVKSKKKSRFERGLARGLAWSDVEQPVLTARGRKVAVAYSDAGALKLRLSDDAGASFGGAESLADGTSQKPSRARSISLSGTRLVVEAIDRSGGGRVPARLESTDLGSSWSGLVFGNDGVRLGALQKVSYGESRLKEVLHDDGSRVDTLRARYEGP